LVDQNDPPKNVTIQGSLTGRVKENANDELIGELVISDEDASQSHVYALKDARFTIKGSKLYTSPEANFNYEEQQEFEIVVASTDNGRPPLSVQRNLTVMVGGGLIIIMIIMMMMIMIIIIMMIIIMVMTIMMMIKIMMMMIVIMMSMMIILIIMMMMIIIMMTMMIIMLIM
jgi:ABC-type multidrug transport system fused ATPase/permease subunit